MQPNEMTPNHFDRAGEHLTEAKRSVVFVVDDESVVASTLEIILLSHGYDTRSFFDPLDALKAAQSVAPTILLADVMMPSMNGLELAIEMRKLYPACKVLLFSGHTGTARLFANAKADGCDFELLTKPVHPVVLMDKISEVLAAGA
jgi:FixJ family two-component response regulator